MENMSSAVHELATKHLGEFKLRKNELVAEYCPFCNGGSSHDKYTFGIGLYNGAYSCKRGSCGVTGSFKSLCEHFGEIPPSGIVSPTFINTGVKQNKVYNRPDPEKLLPVTDEILSYFAARKISEETVNAFKIASDEHGNIVFPFYRDDTLVYVKYRRPEKYRKGSGPKEWQESGTEPILFGMDNVSFSQPLIITEGQLDAMSLFEAGNTNVVSVPCGCNNLDWVPNCYDWLENFNQIILFGDQDEPGITMMQTLLKRLGEDRCMMAPTYPDLIVDGVATRQCKDANEILFCYGAEGLNDVLKMCQPAPIEGILNLADVPFIDQSQVKRIYTRIPMLDQSIGGFGEGGLTVISGKRGEGKSTIGGELLLNAIEQGHTVAAYSGELAASRFLEWIFSQATERRYMEAKTDPRNGKTYATVPIAIQERIRKWIDKKFFLFDNTTVDQGSLIDSLVYCLRAPVWMHAVPC